MESAHSSSSNSEQSEEDWNWLNSLFGTAREVLEVAQDDFDTIKRRCIDENEKQFKKGNQSTGSWLAKHAVNNLAQSMNDAAENFSQMKLYVLEKLKQRYPHLNNDKQWNQNDTTEVEKSNGTHMIESDDKVTEESDEIIENDIPPSSQIQSISYAVKENSVKNGTEEGERHSDSPNSRKSTSSVEIVSSDEDIFASPNKVVPVAELSNMETVNHNVISCTTFVLNCKQEPSLSSMKITSDDYLTQKQRVLMMTDSSDDDFKPTPILRRPKNMSKKEDNNTISKTPHKISTQVPKKLLKVSSSESEDDVPPEIPRLRSSLNQQAKGRRKKVDPNYWKTRSFKDDPKLNKKSQVLLEKLDPAIQAELENYVFIKIEESSSNDEYDSSDDENMRVERAIKDIDNFDPVIKIEDSRQKASQKLRKRNDRKSKKEVICDVLTSEDDSAEEKSFSTKVFESQVPKVICSDEESSFSSGSTDDETTKRNVLRDSDEEKFESELKEKTKKKSGEHIAKESQGPKPNYYTPAVCKLSSSSDDEMTHRKFKKKIKSERKDVGDLEDNSDDDFVPAKRANRRVVRKLRVSSDSENNDKPSKSDNSNSDSSIDTNISKKRARVMLDSSGDEKPKMKKRRRKINTQFIDSDDSSGKSATRNTDIQEIEQDIQEMEQKERTKDDIQEVEQEERSQSLPTQGRKNIKKILSKRELERSTRLAVKEEDERKRRVLQKQKLFNEQFQLALPESETLTSLVLDFDRVSKEPTVTVDPSIVCKLKPHQAEGIQFMYNSTIESIEQINKQSPGGGCIIAHCMGLGKTLSSVAFVHSILTNEKMKMKTALIVCPLNTVGNWYHEFKMWLKEVDQKIKIHKLWDKKIFAERADALAYLMREGGVGIIHYELFRRLSDLSGEKKVSENLKEEIYKNLLNPGPDVVICDEGHLLKNDKSKLSIAVNKIRTKRRIVLTGTPLQNNLAEYHTMMSFVKPKLLGTLKEFQNRFSIPIKNGQHADSTDYDVKLMKRRAHVLHKLLDGCVQRLDYSVLLPYLPPKFEYVVMTKMTPKQVELYKFYLENLKSRTSQWDRRKLLLKCHSLLLKIWTHPIVLTYKNRKQRDLEVNKALDDFFQTNIADTLDNKDEDLLTATEKSKEVAEKSVVDETDKELSPDWYMNFFASKADMMDPGLSGKLTVLMEILKICESIGDKLLVFSQYLSSLNLIEEFLADWDQEAKEKATQPGVGTPSDVAGRWRKNIEYFRIDGGTRIDERQDQCEKFNSKRTNREKLFLISTKAGGLGINLIGANRVVVFDASWNPSHDTQSVFRVFRLGQSKPCYIYRLLAEGTMEEKIYNRQVVKLSLSGRVVDEHQIERHFKFEEVNAWYNYDDPDEKVDRPIPPVPKDKLLADLLLSQKELITTYLEHDTLLENKMDEGLTEEERKAAWDEYNSGKEARGSNQQMTEDDGNKYDEILKSLQLRHGFGQQELKDKSDQIFTLFSSLEKQQTYYHAHKEGMSEEEKKARSIELKQIHRQIQALEMENNLVSQELKEKSDKISSAVINLPEKQRTDDKKGMSKEEKKARLTKQIHRIQALETANNLVSQELKEKSDKISSAVTNLPEKQRADDKKGMSEEDKKARIMEQMHRQIQAALETANNFVSQHQLKETSDKIYSAVTNLPEKQRADDKKGISEKDKKARLMEQTQSQIQALEMAIANSPPARPSTSSLSEKPVQTQSEQ